MEVKKEPEGVVAASVVRSPGGSNVERAPQAQRTPPAQQDLAVDMVDGFEASEQGRRTPSPRIFMGTAASGGSKRKWAVYQDGPFTTSPRPCKKQAMARDIFVIPAAPGPPPSPILPTTRASHAAPRFTHPAALSPTPTKGKRKRAGNHQEAATMARRPAKRRAASHAASTAPLLTAAWEASRAPSTTPFAPVPPRGTEAGPPGIAASAAAPPLGPETGATNNADSLAAVSASTVQATAVVARYPYPGSAPVYFLPGFSTPLFSAVAPTPAPAPMLAPPPAPIRTLLPSPVITGPVTPVPAVMESSPATGPRVACPVEVRLNNFHIYEDTT